LKAVLNAIGEGGSGQLQTSVHPVEVVPLLAGRYILERSLVAGLGFFLSCAPLTAGAAGAESEFPILAPPVHPLNSSFGFSMPSHSANVQSISASRNCS
jgi:hypothetical protein